jgi:hypothetical protein
MMVLKSIGTDLSYSYALALDQSLDHLTPKSSLQHLRLKWFIRRQAALCRNVAVFGFGLEVGDNIDNRPANSEAVRL